MLLRTLAAVALLCVLAASLLHACAALASARVRRVAAAAADRAFARDLVTVRDALAAAIRGGADPRTLTIAPSPSPSTCALAEANDCALWSSERIAATTASPVGTAIENGAGCLPRCAVLQANDAIAEGRIAVAIDASVAGGTGEIYARRRRLALFRTLRVPPYAALIGTRDVTDEAIARGGSTGEDGGAPATLVQVRYVNAATGASMQANAWQSRGWDDGGTTNAGWDP